MPLTTKEIKLPTLKFNCIFLPEPHSKFLKATVVVESEKVRGMTTTWMVIGPDLLEHWFSLCRRGLNCRK